MRSATRNDAATSWRVTGKAPRISARAGCFDTHEVPKLPARTLRSHRAYWTGSGWSSPISCRIWAMAWGVASVPSMTAAGSPGMRRTMVKTIIERNTRTTASWTTRSTR